MKNPCSEIALPKEESPLDLEQLASFFQQELLNTTFLTKINGSLPELLIENEALELIIYTTGKPIMFGMSVGVKCPLSIRFNPNIKSYLSDKTIIQHELYHLSDPDLMHIVAGRIVDLEQLIVDKLDSNGPIEFYREVIKTIQLRINHATGFLFKHAVQPVIIK